jgi:hypothetical protein
MIVDDDESIVCHAPLSIVVLPRLQAGRRVLAESYNGIEI